MTQNDEIHRQWLRAKISELEQALVHYRGVLDTIPPARVIAIPAVKTASSKGKLNLVGKGSKSAILALYAYIGPQRLTLDEILATLLKYGWTSESSNPRDIVHTSLKRFTREGVFDKEKRLGRIRYWPKEL